MIEMAFTVLAFTILFFSIVLLICALSEIFSIKKQEMATRNYRVNPYPILIDIDGRRTIIDESAGDLGI